MTQSESLGSIVGTRNLTFTRVDGTVEQVTVMIGTPVQADDDQWLCPYLIKAESFEKQFRMAGIDSMQALIHSVQIISVELDALARRHDGTFRFFDGTDTLFPQPGLIRP